MDIFEILDPHETYADDDRFIYVWDQLVRKFHH